MEAKNIHLKQRFIITFIFLIVIPIFIIMGTIIFSYYNILIQSKLEDVKNLTRNSVEVIDDEIRRLSLKVSALSYHDRFLKLSNDYNKSESLTLDFQNAKELEYILDTTFDYSDDLISLVIYFKDRGPYYHKLPLLDDIETVKGDLWFKYINDNPEKVYFIDDLTYQMAPGLKSYRYAVAVKPPTTLGDGIEGLLVLHKSNTIINLSSSNDNRNNFAIKSPDNSLLLGIDNLDNSNDLIYKMAIEKVDWDFLYELDIREIRQPVFKSVLVLVVFLIGITVMFVIFIRYQINKLILPIEETLELMPLVEKGDFSVRLNPSEIMELDKMSKSFNQMVSEIGNLTEEIKIQEREKRISEIEALQFQINPHFLSNTLNAIKVMARLLGANEIRETTTALMRIVSNSFRDPGELNSVEQEIKNIEDYIHIMKVRFGDSFSVKIRYPDGIKNLKIMKMLIQPLVENAILHGLNPDSGPNVLFIKFIEVGNRLEISVIDNGIGIDKELLDFGKDHSKKGLYNIGISNIMDRIALNYGDGYGLSFNSKIDKYTKFKLLLPIIKE